MKKKPAPSPGTEQAGGVQGRSRALLPRSVQELRRRLWRVVLAVQQTVHHLLPWSQWRRGHQTVAPYDHYQRREALAEALAA